MQLSGPVLRILRLLALWSAFAGAAQAAVLPEDRADAMYHSYDGGGVKVTGPALLLRKSVGGNASVSASYYVDSISGASIDVVTTASPYKEKRTEYGVGVDYLHRDTAMQLSYTTSEESDYLADTVNVGVAHELYGGQSTLSLGYSRGRDVVGRSDTDFEEDIDRQQYRLGWSQIMSKTLVVSLDYESVAEAGYLNNPYRSARILGASVPERYPGARTSNAVALRAVKGFVAGDKLESSARLDYRYFWDTWDVRAHTMTAAFQRYLDAHWLAEVHYRYYAQDGASFYSDNFSIELNYMARDKELSTFSSHTVGAKATYRLSSDPAAPNKSTLNVAYDLIKFNYDDFTDVRTGDLYSFTARVLQLYVSLWY